NLLDRELEIRLGQLRLALNLAEDAVAADDWRSLELQVDIACTLFDGAAKNEFQIHGCRDNRSVPAEPLAAISLGRVCSLSRAGTARRRPAPGSASTRIPRERRSPGKPCS